MGWFDFLSDNKSEKPSEIEHLKLGKLIYEDEGWWKGETFVNGYNIEIFVNGTENGMFPFLADDCAEVLSDFPTYLQQSLTLLKKTLKDIGINKNIDFVPTQICLFWRDETDKGFSMYFDDPDRRDVLWTVEFVNLQAKYAGCDT